MTVEIVVDVNPPAEITVAESPAFTLEVPPPASIELDVAPTAVVELDVQAPPVIEVSIGAPVSYELSIQPPPIVEFGITTIGGGGGGSDHPEEVSIGPGQPLIITDLWVDTDAYDPGGGGETVTDFYTHTQAMPSKTWVVEHNMNRMPAVQMTDSADSQIAGSVHHDSLMQLTITFAVAITGLAYCT